MEDVRGVKSERGKGKGEPGGGDKDWSQRRARGREGGPGGGDRQGGRTIVGLR